MDVNRTTLSIAAGVAGTLFLGYCIYFDKKRRSDPEYKKKIRERKFSGGDAERVLVLYASRDLPECDMKRKRE